MSMKAKLGQPIRKFAPTPLPPRGQQPERQPIPLSTVPQKR